MNEQSLSECWEMFHREYSVSVDKMICDPQLRQEFIESAQSACKCTDEQEILWTLMSLRKQKGRLKLSSGQTTKKKIHSL